MRTETAIHIIMKRTLFLLVASLTCHYAVTAQTSTSSPTDAVISSPRTSSNESNALGPATLSFTNQSGVAYSVADLEGVLRNLQSHIDQTLPILSAFNTNFGSASGGSAAEALGGVLSKVLSKNRGQNSSQDASENSSSSGGSSVTSNLVGVLRGILTTNNSNAVTINPNTVAQLQALQHNLQVATSILRTLNVESFPEGTGQTNAPALTPTGRQPNAR
jgi:hypothetical protein